MAEKQSPLRGIAINEVISDKIRTALLTEVDAWVKSQDVTLRCYQLERAVRAFLRAGERIEALALIRAAYNCSLRAGETILDAIGRRTHG